eukprot:GHVR01106713.1.p1 GENE.GHVR01106713.1~~GHVR01106713.1.p1  ORF type:complete len:115 (+),score=39.31 GHVR01106713.1:354-698(+)
MVMKYMAAYMMLSLNGSEKPSTKDIENLLKTVGIDSQKDELQLVVDSLKNKKLSELIAEGLPQLSSYSTSDVGCCGAAAATADAPAAAGKGDKPAAKVEAKEEEEEAMDFDLFD